MDYLSVDHAFTGIIITHGFLFTFPFLAKHSLQFSLFDNKGAHTCAEQFAEYKHNKTYLQSNTIILGTLRE